MLRVALVSVLLAVAAADKLDDLDDDGIHQSYAAPASLPAPAPAPAPAPLPGGPAPTDAVEVATQQFLAEYARRAAAAEAAPDIDIHTTADGLPLPSAQPSYSAPAAPAAPAAVSEPQTATYFPPEVNTYSTSSYHEPQQPAPLLYDSEGNLLGVADTDDVAEAKRLFHAQYDATAAQLAAQQGPRQPQASLLYDEEGTVVGVAETDDVREAKARFQAHYDEIIASQQAAAAPAAAGGSYGV